MVASIKTRLRSGNVIAVCDPDFPTPRMVDFIGTLGFDALFIDCEHSSTDFKLVEELTRAARAAGLESVVRPWANDEGLLNRFLSCGAGGLQVPHVQDAADARRIVDGLRSWGDGNFEDKLLVVMIESAEAIRSLPELLRIPEIDVFYFGTNDLAMSMGLRGQAEHATVRAAVEDGIRQVAQAGCVAGINVQNDLETAGDYLALGARWITVHQRVFIRRGAQSFLGALRNNGLERPLL